MGTIALQRDPVVTVGKASAAIVAWRHRGELRVTAIVKATFAFAPDATMPRIDPEPIARDDGDDVVSDLAPYLKRADVVFTGGSGVAAGATVGLAVAAGARPLLDKTVVADAHGAAAFAPIARAAPARARLLGALPAPFVGTRVEEIAPTFDWDYFQAAPVDQRTDYLRGDEWIMIEGLCPGGSDLRTRLPGARGEARIYGLAKYRLADGKALAMNADLLHVRGDERRCTVTWRGSFALAEEAALPSVRLVVGVELPGEPIAWPEHAAGRRSPADATLPLPESGSAKKSAPLPFVDAPHGTSPALRSPAPKAPRRAARSEADATLPLPEGNARRRTLPFEGVDHPGDPPRAVPDHPGDRPRALPDSAPQAAAAKKAPGKEFIVSSPLTEADPSAKPAPPAAVRAPEKKLPPKVDVANKLYGVAKKR